jgi:hypothetical protein
MMGFMQALGTLANAHVKLNQKVFTVATCTLLDLGSDVTTANTKNFSKLSDNFASLNQTTRVEKMIPMPENSLFGDIRTVGF